MKHAIKLSMIIFLWFLPNLVLAAGILLRGQVLLVSTQHETTAAQGVTVILKETGDYV